MSSRLVQYRNPLDYTRRLGMLAARLVIPADAPHPRYNVAPGSRPFVIFADGTVRTARWNRDAAGRALSAVVDAGADTLLAPQWQAGRILVPADGWYIWREQGGARQPWFVTAVGGQSLYLAALSAAVDATDDTGFTLLGRDAMFAGTAEALSPVALDAAQAQQWLDRRTSVQDALRLLGAGSVDPDALSRRPASERLNDETYDGPDLIAPQGG
jgi:putative SOS response-associated peptidase YedK